MKFLTALAAVLFTGLSTTIPGATSSAIQVDESFLASSSFFVPHGIHSRTLAARQTTTNPQEFCRWWGHQSLLLNNKIYVDGGIRTFRENYKDGILYIYFSISNLDTSRGLQFPIKQSSREWSTGVVANANGEATLQGAIYTDGGNSIYKYGGWFADNNTWTRSAQVVVRQAQMWKFDLQASKWEEQPLVGDKIVRAYGGAYVSVPETKKAYYIGGVISQDTDSAFEKLNGEMILDNSFLTLDTDRVSWTNNTRIEGAAVGPVAMANVVHIGAFGKDKKGVLILLGGITAERGTLVTNANAGNVLSLRPLDKIHIYDIATSRWYVQKTGGTPPPSRIGSCSVLVPSSDGTSYNIIVYGGAVPQTGAMFGDTWVLSIPSFQWIKLDDSGEKKYMHTCHVIKDSKMVVIGGKDLGQQDAGNPAANYTTNPENWSCDPLGFVSALDLNRVDWMPNGVGETAEPFRLAAPITAVIGGDELGNATVLSPPQGWDDSALDTILHVSAGKNNNPDPNGPDGPDVKKDDDKKAPLGAIVGGAVGGVIVLALIALGIFFCLKKKKKAATDKDAAAAAGLNAPIPPPHPDYHNPHNNPNNLTTPLAYQDPRNSLLSNAPPYPGSPAPYWAASPPPNVDQQNAYYAQQQQQGGYNPHAGYVPQQVATPPPQQHFPYPALGSQIAEVSGDSSYYAPAKVDTGAPAAAASGPAEGSGKPPAQQGIASELQ